ncbi:MAG TPA: HAD-IA family hydrolase [Chloroflexia bacterium]|nr:HAD-IA family hydrolase [Chloroflexia bacterium]
MQAFIFDMDGVIVDSEIHWKSVEGYFLSRVIPGWTEEDQGRIVGISLDNLFTMLRDEYGYSGSREQFLETYHANAHRIYTEKVELLPGFEGLLSLLHENGVMLALASSSPRAWIDLVLERFDLRRAFDVTVSAEEIEGEGKPSPAIYLHTARKLGVDPARCVVVEDSRNGVLSARAAGMYCIGLRNGFNDDQDLSEADILVNGLGEIDWPTLMALVKR